MRDRLDVSLAILALLAALGSTLYLIFAPLYQSLTTDPATGKQIEGTATLIQVNGLNVLIPLAIPPVLATAALLAELYTDRAKPWLVWVTAFLLCAFTLITGFSIGVFYVPAMLILIACAIVTQVKLKAKS